MTAVKEDGTRLGGFPEVGDAGVMEQKHIVVAEAHIVCLWEYMY